MSTGKCIRETRIRRGLTQEDVAKIVGVATQTIYKYEKEIVTNIINYFKDNIIIYVSHKDISHVFTNVLTFRKDL